MEPAMTSRLANSWPFARKHSKQTAATMARAPLRDEDLLHAVRHEIAQRSTVPADDVDILDALAIVNGEASVLNVADTVQQLETIHRELAGLGAIAEVLGEPEVTDVLVNPDGSVWVDRGSGMQSTHLKLASQEVRELAIRLATACGTRLDDAQPFADGILDHLPAGITANALRVHAVLSPPARGGACISIRTLNFGGRGLGELAQRGMMPKTVLDALRDGVRQRKNMLITGGTGTGKTTLLSALLGEVPYNQRTILVEDTPEFLPTHPHVVKLTSRSGNADGAGAVDMTTLLRQCLRMRPDRIVVGEIRGAEVADLLVALNTGHAGSAGTMHANSITAVPGRLAALGVMAGMTPDAVHAQAADGIDMVVHLERIRGVRKVGALAVTDGANSTGLHLRTIWHREEKEQC